MQDLTFGEQVKIVLSRKNMTIKELARKIELRTKKKMSRQNLTQRLGRDNFQEQDMRMISEILGCSFYLDILGDNAAVEATGEKVMPAAENGEKKEPPEKLTKSGLAEDRSAEYDLEESDPAKSRLEESNPAEKNLAESDPADRIQEQTEELPDPENAAGKEKDQNAKEAGGRETDEKASPANERDITIGELVDINEELDAMMEKAASESLGQRGARPEDRAVKEYVGSDGADTPVLEHAGYDGADAPVKEHAGYDEEEVQTQTMPDEAAEGEPVEKLLEEIESIERENKREEQAEEKLESREKPHGWRTYLMQRLKRLGKESSAEDYMPKDESLKETNPENAKETEAALEGDHAENSDAQNGYPEGGYAENGYLESGYAENGYPESGYAENSYAENNPEMMAEEVIYAEEEYVQTPPQEDEEVGEYNPYTGKEYESNSVRMHPSRIGYVQVYDRSNHQWMDMTEWAFLGYQERKKQLLGKDYDPPIYLD